MSFHKIVENMQIETGKYKINMHNIIPSPESPWILNSTPDRESPCSWLLHSEIRFKNRHKLVSEIDFQKWQCKIEKMEMATAEY